MQSSITFLLILALFTVFYSGTCVSGAPQGLGGAVDGVLKGTAYTGLNIIDGVDKIFKGITTGGEGAIVGALKGLTGKNATYGQQWV